jgi:hypothetical protein
MCAKKRVRWTRCEEWRCYQEAAYAEWCEAWTLSEVRAAWGRFGGRVTAHRHGAEQFREMARKRWARDKVAA